jgi:hypothetical protein
VFGIELEIVHDVKEVCYAAFRGKQYSSIRTWRRE